jgi:hypothetical protein
MKRDMDLIRRILIEIEEKDKEIHIEDYSEEQINYHKALLIEAELVEGKVHYSSRGGKNSDIIPDWVYIIKLTWQGHEFLDQARSETVWNKAKKFLTDKGMDFSIHAFKIALGEVTKRMMIQ